MELPVVPILNRSMFIALVLFISFAHEVYAQKGPETTLTKLPQDHPYQITLVKFLATLTEKDFIHGVTDKIPEDKTTSTDPEYLYRQYMMTLMHQPLIGNKRAAPAITAPPSTFVLTSIETPKAVMPPPVWAETLIPFVQWDYPGNHYRSVLRHGT